MKSSRGTTLEKAIPECAKREVGQLISLFCGKNRDVYG